MKNDGRFGMDRDLRSAIDAATSLYHFREHLPLRHRKSPAEIVVACADYNLLGDIVNASKHGVLNRGIPQIASFQDLRQYLVCTRFQDEVGEYFDNDKIVTVHLVDGSERDLFDVMINVFEFWLRYLNGIGANPPVRSFSNPKRGFVSRDQAKAISVEVAQSLQPTLHHRIQEYNYATGSIDVVDLSGRKLEMRISQPEQITFALKSDDGKCVRQTVTLTWEQSEKLRAMKGESEKNRYLLSMAKGIGIQDKLLQEYVAKYPTGG